MSRRLVLDDGRVRRDLVVRDAMTVGRDPACDVSDSDPRLSRRHARFELTSEGLLVRDLDSRNGVRVNGRPVREAVLAPGDLVEIAHLAVRFVEDAGDPAGDARPTVVPVPAARVQVREEFEDDRTRVLPAQPLSTAVSGPISESVRRQALAVAAAGPADLPLTPPRHRAAGAPSAGRLGVRELLATGWGWRVLLQGSLLAGLVFLVTAVPMLSWFTATTGPIRTGMLVRMLAAPLLASLIAGLMAAALIARTTARGLQTDERP